ncbi:MAG: hypothetical protein ACLQKH_08340, partial [Steroidobacteraceae bacterium]
MVIREPVCEDLVFARITRTKHREKTGVQICKGIDVLSVNVLDPLAILLRMSTVANADEQLRCVPNATKHIARARAIGHPPGHVISPRIDYGFEAGAAGAAGSEDAAP